MAVVVVVVVAILHMKLGLSPSPMSMATKIATKVDSCQWRRAIANAFKWEGELVVAAAKYGLDHSMFCCHLFGQCLELMSMLKL